MNLRKTLFSSFMTAGLLLGMTGGAVAAQTSSDSTNLQVTCNNTHTVNVAVDNDLVLNIPAYSPSGYDSDVAADNMHITMDLGCTFSNDFAVTAEIGTFRLNGTSLLWAFSGSRLVANSGSIDSYDGPSGALFGFPLVGAPDVNPVIFDGTSSSGTAIGPEEIVVLSWPIFISYDKYSTGETVATWDMQLKNLPDWLYAYPGVYTAPLTVTLAVN